MRILAQLPLNLQAISYKDIPVGGVFCNNTGAYLKGPFGYVSLNTGDYYTMEANENTFYVVEVFTNRTLWLERNEN